MRRFILSGIVFMFWFQTRLACFADSEVVREGVEVKLHDVIKHSLKDDAAIKRAEARLKKEEELYKAVKRSVFPRFTTDFYSAAVSEDRGAVTFWKSEIRLPLFEGGKWVHERNKKSYEVFEEKLNLETVRQNVVYELKALYVAILREKENTRLAQGWVREAEKLYFSMKALLDRELVTREALYRWEAAYRSAQNELVKHKQAMDYGEALIREIARIPESERLEFEPLNNLTLSPINFQNSLSEMKTKNPLYELARLRVKAKKEEIEILRADRFPKLGLSTRFNLARDSFIDQNRFEIGLVSSWNIWDFGVLGHQIRAKEAEVEETREDGRAQTEELEHELRKLIGDIKIARAKMDAVQSIAKEKKEAYASGKTKLITAEKSEAELFDSFVALTQAEMAVVEAFSEYRLTRARLEMIMGSGVVLSAKS